MAGRGLLATSLHNPAMLPQAPEGAAYRTRKHQVMPPHQDHMAGSQLGICSLSCPTSRGVASLPKR
eukprot:375155-Pelagomonas_calceolata.AAC.1